MATPRTVGLIPRQREAPALPKERKLCSELDTSPIHARHVAKIFLISPERKRNVTYSPSREIICTDAPALRAICAPFPGRISIQCTTVPTGILCKGKQFPGLIGASGPDIILSPTFTSLGAII